MATKRVKRERSCDETNGSGAHLERTGDSLCAKSVALLNRALGPEFVSKRTGPGGAPLSYCCGHDVIRLANVFFGNDRWTSEVSNLNVEMFQEAGKHSAVVTCKVRVTVSWPDGRQTFHEDFGFGGGQKMPRPSEAVEQGVKEAVTDALKRALRQFGDALGNCLYEKAFLKWLEANRKSLLSGVSRTWDAAGLVRMEHGRVVVQPDGVDPAPPPPPRSQKHCSVFVDKAGDEYDDDDFIEDDGFIMPC